MRALRRYRTPLRYLAFQLPGWTLALLVVMLLVAHEWIAPWMAAVLVAVTVVIDLGMYPWVRAAYEPDSEQSQPSLLGVFAEALEPLAPGGEGWVRVGPERWRARLAEGCGPVATGAALEVREVRSLSLLVAPRADTRVENAARTPAAVLRRHGS